MLAKRAILIDRSKEIIRSALHSEAILGLELTRLSRPNISGRLECNIAVAWMISSF